MSFNILKISQWIVAKYRNFQHFLWNYRALLRIMDVEYAPQTKEPIFLIQQKTDQHCFKQSLTELLLLKNFIDQFNKEDIEKITELKTIWNLTPTLKIIAHLQNDSASELVFRDRTGNTFVDEVKRVGRKEDIIMQLSPKEAFLVGYLLASEEC